MRTLAERFWAKVDKSGLVPARCPDLGPCWLWTSARNKDGYGVIQKGRATTLNAHRVAYEMVVGPPPAGMHLDHLCRVRGCVNPLHLEPVTNRENQLRGETFSARNAAKTTCPAGHSYDVINVRGARRCSICMSATNARSYAKRKAQDGALA